jgi:hypothetical protein
VSLNYVSGLCSGGLRQRLVSIMVDISMTGPGEAGLTIYERRKDRHWKPPLPPDYVDIPLCYVVVLLS